MNHDVSKKTGFGVRRKTLVSLGLLVVALAGVWGLWYYLTHPPRPWLVRWQVTRYLKKHSTGGGFQVEFAFPSQAEMRRTPPPSAGLLKGPRTGKDFDTLAAEYIRLKTELLQGERDLPDAERELKDLKPRLEQYAQRLAEGRAGGATNLAVLEGQVNALRQRTAALEKRLAALPELQKKEQALGPIVEDLWDFQRAWEKEMQAPAAVELRKLEEACDRLVAEVEQRLQEARSYEAMYKAIGQELWVAERLAASANPAHRRVAVRLALEASDHAQNDAMNGWLACRICEGYVWPHLDLATDSNRRSLFHPETFLERCADVFRRNDDFATLARNYELALARAKTPQQRDSAHSQIAWAYEQGGELKNALYHLKQIKATNDYRRVLWRIPRLEQRLKAGQ